MKKTLLKVTVDVGSESLTSLPGIGAGAIRMPVLRVTTRVGKLSSVSWFGLN